MKSKNRYGWVFRNYEREARRNRRLAVMLKYTTPSKILAAEECRLKNKSSKLPPIDTEGSYRYFCRKCKVFHSTVSLIGRSHQIRHGSKILKVAKKGKPRM